MADVPVILIAHGHSSGLHQTAPGTVQHTSASAYNSKGHFKYLPHLDLTQGRAMAVQDFAEGPWRQVNLDAGASMIITVPTPLGGVLVVGEASVAYISGSQPMKCTPITQTVMRVCTIPLLGFAFARDLCSLIAISQIASCFGERQPT